MGLDEKLIQIHGLEVASVERVIGDIERIKLQEQAVSENFNQELARYGDLITGKLLRIIENIYLLGNQIFRLKEESYSFHPVEVEDRTKRINLYKGNVGEGFSFGVNNFMEHVVDFSFGRDFTPKKIALSTYDWVDEDKKKKRRGSNEYVTKIEALSICEFVDRFTDLLIDYHKNPSEDKEKHHLDSLPFVLNLVPSLLSKIYEGVMNGQEGKLKNLQSRSRDLNGLEVSDII